MFFACAKAATAASFELPCWYMAALEVAQKRVECISGRARVCVSKFNRGFKLWDAGLSSRSIVL